MSSLCPLRSPEGTWERSALLKRGAPWATEEQVKDEWERGIPNLWLSRQLIRFLFRSENQGRVWPDLEVFPERRWEGRNSKPSLLGKFPDVTTHKYRRRVFWTSWPQRGNRIDRCQPLVLMCLSRQWIADQFSSACCLFSSVTADSIITLFDFSRGISPWTSDNKEILIESENRVVKQWNEIITVCEGYCVISTSICCNRIIKEASNSQKSCVVSQGHVRWTFVASALYLGLDASQVLLCLGLSEVVGCVHALCGTCLTEQNLDQQASWVPILVVPRFSLWLEGKQANLSAFCFPVWQMRNTLILCQMFQHLHTKKL